MLLGWVALGERKKNLMSAFCVVFFFYSPDENIKVMSGMAILLSENIACHCRIVELEQFFLVLE